MGERVISVLLVDDQPAIRHGLRMRLEVEADIQVVGEAGDGETALTLAAALAPDVIIMDVALPGMDGITATTAMRTIAPHSAVVMLSLYGDQATQARARAAGASAFVEKHNVEPSLLQAIRQAAQLGSQEKETGS
jgi:DNA-binding NarL/FixJ family response regulator